MTNTNIPEQNLVENQGNSFDFFNNINFKYLISRYLKYWWVFVLSLITALGIAHLKCRYTQPVYQCGTVILMHDHTGTRGELTEGIMLSGDFKEVGSKKYIYTSPKIIESALKTLDFNVKHLSMGRFLQKELYGTGRELKVLIDSTHTQPIGASFRIKQVNGNKITLHITAPNGISGYNFDLDKFVDDLPPVSLDTIMTAEMGQPFTTPFCSFTLVPYDPRFFSAAKATNIAFSFVPMQYQIRQWKSGLYMNFQKEVNNVAHITVTGNDYNKTLTFLRALSDAIVDYSLIKKNETADRTLYFINKQILSTTDSLKAAAQKVSSFKRNYGFITTSAYENNLQSDFFDREKNIEQTYFDRDYLIFLDTLLAKGGHIDNYILTAQVVKNNSLIERQLQKIIDLQETYIQYSNVSSKNPEKRKIAEQDSLYRQNVRLIIKQSIDLYTKRIAEHKKSNRDIISKASELPELEQRMLNLEREYKIQDQVYTFMLQKETETLIAKASNVSDNEILEDPQFTAQIAPNTKETTITAALLGLGLPALIFFLFELFNTKIRTLEELKQHVPNLKVINSIPLDLTNSSEIPLISEPQGFVAESFRSLRERIKVVLKTRNNGKIIMVSSSTPADGKTYCTANITTAFAQSGQKVVLVNYDLRRGRIEKTFGIEKHSAGIVDYLMGNSSFDEIIKESNIPNVHVVCSGTTPPNPAELTASAGNLDFINKLRERFDIILLDTAPIGCVSDCKPLEYICDIFIFVVRAKHTDFAHLKDTIDNLKIEYSEAQQIAMPYLLFNGANHSDFHYRNYYNGGYIQKNGKRK